MSDCPSCGQGLDTPDQMVCRHCGYRLDGPDPLADVTVADERRRPIGVTFLAPLFGIIGGFSLVGGVAFMVFPDAFTHLSNPSLVDRLIGGVGAAAGIACLAFALGAWSLKPWARALGIVIIATGIIETLVTDPSTIIHALIGGALIIWYLTSSSVVEAFEPSNAPSGDLLGTAPAPRGTAAPPRSARAERPHRRLSPGLSAGIVIVGLYVAGLGVLAAWTVMDNMPRPLVTAAPGSVGEICFSDSMLDCDPSSTERLDSSHLAYRYTEGVTTRLDLMILRIEGDRERRVFVLNMNRSTLWVGDPRGAGMYGPFDCRACSESAPYVGRVLDGSTLVAEGFFRT